jgi:hypothetical protein
LLFALNRRCVELHIVDVKLCCDLFNTLVHSIASYACEVWVDSKKIEVIKVVYRGFLKSLLKVQKTTSTSIMLAEFSKFPFEHGDKCCCTITVWAQSLKIASWERHGKPSSLCFATGKKCWAGSMKKWLLQNQPQEVVSFLPSVQPSLETMPQLATTLTFQARMALLPLGTVPETMHIHPTRLAGVRGWVENQIPWCNAHNIRVGAQEVWAPPPSSFPHTMLSEKMVKDNMQLAFIDKFFTNREIRTSVQTRYLCFKGMSYKSENYLCDISCVQLQKTLA